MIVRFADASGRILDDVHGDEFLGDQVLGSVLLAEDGVYVIDRREGREFSEVSVRSLLQTLRFVKRRYDGESSAVVYLPRMLPSMYAEARDVQRPLHDIFDDLRIVPV